MSRGSNPEDIHPIMITNITAVDALMGKGKTNFIIAHMNQTHQDWVVSQFTDTPKEKTSFLVVVPFLTEVDRIKQGCPSLEFIDPCPQEGEGKKITHLQRLIEDGENICTTHALFKKLNQSIYKLLTDRQYVLVLDETLESVNIYDSLGKHDKKCLFDKQYVMVDEFTNRLRWNHAEYPNYYGRFNDIMNLCDNGNLVQFRDTVWIWNFPAEFIRCFKEAYVLTYMFHSSPMAAYLRGCGLQYRIRSVNQGRLIDELSIERELCQRADIKKLISIYEGDMNRIGDAKGNEQPLSASWFKREALKQRKGEPNALKGIKASTENFFKRIAITKAHTNAWTTFKDVRKHLKGAGYSREFIPFNTKATNDYRHKESVAYLCNVFMHPYLKGYLESQGTRVDEDGYALSELLQWLWRSQIRDGKPIKVYIPSKRMRTLLRNWLDGVDLIEPAERVAA